MLLTLKSLVEPHGQVRPDFSLKKYLGAGNPRLADCTTNRILISVAIRGVDAPTTKLKPSGYCSNGVLPASACWVGLEARAVDA